MSPDPGWPWSVLGLPGAPATLADVRRAYARALKQIDQATDTAGFAALRAAYENATRRVTTATPPTATPPAGVSSADLSSLPLPQPRPAPQALLPTITPAPDDPQTRLDAAVTALFHALTHPDKPSPAGARILAALANPLSHAPDMAQRLRQTMVGMIQSLARPDSDHGVYLSLDLRPAMQALDARYGWLSDYAAFQDDFWNQPFLLDAMMACAGFKTESPPTITPFTAPETLLAKTATLTRSYTFCGGLAVLVSMAMMAEHWKQAHLQGPVYTVLVLWVVVPVFADTLVSTSWAIGQLGKILTSQRQRLEDRRALRRKDIKLVVPSRTVLQRLDTLLKGGWLWPWSALLIVVLMVIFAG